MSKDSSRKIALKLVYYLVVAKSSGQDYKYFKPKIVIIIYIYTREITPESLKTWWVKVSRKNKIKNKEEEGGEIPIRGYTLGNPPSPPLEKEDRSLLRYECLIQYQFWE